MLIARSPALIVRLEITTLPSVSTLIALPAVDLSVLPLPSSVIALSIVIISFASISRINVIV
jgi:hypothetical protein